MMIVYVKLYMTMYNLHMYIMRTAQYKVCNIAGRYTGQCVRRPVGGGG